jgi:DNA replication protein DnaC
LLPDVDIDNSGSNEQEITLNKLTKSSSSSQKQPSNQPTQNYPEVEETEDDIIADNSRKQKNRIRKKSLYSCYYTWNLTDFMVKSGDDVR